MERRALFETLDLTSPDDYPWPGAAEKDDPDWENEDPAKGVVNGWNWECFCYEQTELRCLVMPDKMSKYRCYVCQKPGKQIQHPDQADTYKCLICDDVYMCKEHSIFLKCLESFARICCRHNRYTPGYTSWNPEGGYPPVEGLPDIPRQERWQDVHDELSKPDKEEPSDDEDFALSHDLTAGAAGSETQSPRGGTSARGD
eukprot:1477342-Amphidinium_carterae.1